MPDYMPPWPLKVLILSSDPRDADRLRLAQEHRDLQIAIRGTRLASSLTVFNEPSCRYSDITVALDRVDPHILHFSGHGGADGLYFEDAQGTAIAVKKQALANVLSHQKELQLVVLNACFSLEQGQGFADAVGLAIVSEGSILDQDAVDFSREFYTALGYGQRSYIEAFERAKAALGMTGEMKVHLLQRETPDMQDVLAHSSVARGFKGSQTQLYTVAWVCLSVSDRILAIATLDECHTNIQHQAHQNIDYAFGRIGLHNVVIASPAVMHSISVAHIAEELCQVFPSVRFGLLVGIGGGLAFVGEDIRLGDVVVGFPSKYEGEFQVLEFLNNYRVHSKDKSKRTLEEMTNAMNLRQQKYSNVGTELSAVIGGISSKFPELRAKCIYPGEINYELFEAHYWHCSPPEYCGFCRVYILEERQRRKSLTPEVHYGNILSTKRSELDKAAVFIQKETQHIAHLKILAIDIETFGLGTDLPALSIRGICDYSDNHRDSPLYKQWHPYAAVTAAAYAKLMLSVIPAS